MIARSPCGVGSMSGKWPSSSAEARVVTEDRLAAAVHPDDVRRPLEGAPHQRDPAVLAQMGDGLGVASGEVEVGHGELVEHRERAAQPLGGEVDRAVAGQGCGRGEEDVLRLDEGAEPAVYAFVCLSHVDYRVGGAAASPGFNWWNRPAAEAT